MKFETWERLETVLLDGQKTLGELAERLGKSPQVLSLQLEQMRKKKIIEKQGRQGTFKIFKLTEGNPRARFFEFGRKITLISNCFDFIKKTEIPHENRQALDDEAKRIKDVLARQRELLRGKSPNLAKIGNQTSDTLDALQKLQIRKMEFTLKHLDKHALEKSMAFIGSVVLFALEKAGDNRLFFLDFCRGFEYGIGDLFLHKSRAFKGIVKPVQVIWNNLKKPTKARGNQPQALEGTPQRRLSNRGACKT